MQKILIHSTSHPKHTELYFGQGFLTEALSKMLAQRTCRVVIVTDHAVHEQYGRPLAKILSADLLTIQVGEESKNLKTVSDLLDQLFRLGADRNTTLIALGGGVTTDLVSFVASLYMRGIPLILIPTTLLACVDAAIGGKTGINTPFGKNLVGTFYSPEILFVDLDILQTLPEREWLNGMAELLKLGLVYDHALWNGATQPKPSATLVLQAIRGKIALIEQDAKERGIRRILNFGHTIGHALEKVADYTLPHGEAVALGCVIESHLSTRFGILSTQEFMQIQKRFEPFHLTLPKAYTRNQLFSALSHDKKKEFGLIRCVLIDRIGHALPFEGAYCRAVSENELTPTLEWMEDTFL